MKKLKVCLAWHDLNSTNYGVGALAISHLNLINEIAVKSGIEIEIDTIGFPDATNLESRNLIEKKLDRKIGHLEMSLKGTLLDIIKFKLGKQFYEKSYDYVFDIGAGDSFADIYGFKRFFFMVITKYFALKGSKGLVLSPQTVGPFKNKLLEKVAKYFMKKSKAVFVRDFKSYDYLQSIGIDSKQVSDVAFVLPYDNKPKQENVVGVNISGLLFNGGYTKNNQFNLSLDYASFIVNQIKGFLERGKSVHLISHVIDDDNFVEDDYRACLTVKQNFANNVNVIVAPKFRSAIEAKSYISSLEFFTGSRMHATIGAVSCGVPTVPIAYSRKFSGVFGSIDYSYTLEAYQNATEEELLKLIFTYFDNDIKLMQTNAEKAANKARLKLNDYTSQLEQILS